MASHDENDADEDAHTISSISEKPRAPARARAKIVSRGVDRCFSPTGRERKSHTLNQEGRCRGPTRRARNRALIARASVDALE
jgi:hypothetical protein